MTRVPYFRVSKPNAVKHHFKHLADIKKPADLNKSLTYADPAVIRRICDGALNVAKGDIALTPRQRTLFKKHSKLIGSLVDPAKHIESKRTLLKQKGGNVLLKILLPLVIETVGSLLFKRK